MAFPWPSTALADRCSSPLTGNAETGDRRARERAAALHANADAAIVLPARPQPAGNTIQPSISSKNALAGVLLDIYARCSLPCGPEGTRGFINRHGPSSNTMALITSDCVAKRLPEHQMALITSGCAAQQALRQVSQVQVDLGRVSVFFHYFSLSFLWPFVAFHSFRCLLFPLHGLSLPFPWHFAAFSLAFHCLSLAFHCLGWPMGFPNPLLTVHSNACSPFTRVASSSVPTRILPAVGHVAAGSLLQVKPPTDITPLY